MADISHIKGPDNTSYDIKDATARSDISNKVSKSGDTMTGELTIQYAGSNLKPTRVSLFDDEIDVSKSNNNISSTKYPGFAISDASRTYCKFEGDVYPNGDIGSFWLIRQFNTSGVQTEQKGINMRMAKNGTLTYNISDPSNFLSALNVKEIYASDIFSDTSNIGNFKGYRLGPIIFIARCYFVNCTVHSDSNFMKLTTFKNGFVPATTVRALADIAGDGKYDICFLDSSGYILLDRYHTTPSYTITTSTSTFLYNCFYMI